MKSIWKPKMAAMWKEYFPPAKPLTSELAIYANGLAEKKHSKGEVNLLILGATPELRDLGFEYGYNVYCLENNRVNFQRLKGLRRFSSDDTLVLGDWRRPQVALLFDVIMGDTAISLLPVDCWQGILDSLSHLLTPSGRFVHRFLAWLPEDKEFLGKFDENEFAELVQAARINHHAFYPSVIGYLYRAFTRLDWSVNCRDWLGKIQEEHKRGVVTDLEYGTVKYLQYQAQKEDFSIFIPPKDQVDLIMSRRFEVIAIEQGDNFFPFTKNALIYSTRCIQ